MGCSPSAGAVVPLEGSPPSSPSAVPQQSPDEGKKAEIKKAEKRKAKNIDKADKTDKRRGGNQNKEINEDNFIQGFDEETKEGTKYSDAAARALAQDREEAETEKAIKRTSAGPKKFLGPAKGHTAVTIDLDDDDEEDANIEIGDIMSSNDRLNSVIKDLADEEDDDGFDPSKFKVANSSKDPKLGFVEDESNAVVVVEGNTDIIADLEPELMTETEKRGISTSRSPETTGIADSNNFLLSNEDLMREITSTK